jgi:AcrR family transcriptional regulator
MVAVEALSKRECILLEAAKMFARFGFKKTSIDEIAREAGVGKGTVYLTADSKEELFYQVLHREVRAWQAECAKVVDPRVPADELLVQLAETARKNLRANGLVHDLFRGEMAKMLPRWASRFDELRVLGRSNIEEVLRIGVKQKKFRKDIDVEATAEVLQNMHLANLILKPQDQSETDAARIALAGFTLVLNGLLQRA